jgi:methionine aminotransferase
VNTPIQLAIATFMKDVSNIKKLNKFYQDKRDSFASLIKDSRFSLKSCSGTYFQLLDYSKISDKHDLEFSEYLTKEIGVATIPLSPFFSKCSEEKLIRICFAKKDEILKQAADKLCQI